MSFESLWGDLLEVGWDRRSGGYRRFAWTDVDRILREWFVGEARRRGLDLTVDRAGNQWAWWGDPDAADTRAAGASAATTSTADGTDAGATDAATTHPGRRGTVVTGSHLDSVPDGGAFDGPLGVVSAFAAVDALRDKGFRPAKPIGVVNFVDEEGARFGIACAGSRIITGALAADRARALKDGDGVTMAEAQQRAGQNPEELGRDDETLARIGTFVELHVEQGRGLIDLGRPVAVADSIWPHGRWRIELPGQANHAGTTRLEDRRDPMLAYARTILLARASATRHGALATCGKVRVEPNGVNAIPSGVTAWLDARGPDPAAVERVVAELAELTRGHGGTIERESWTASTAFDVTLRDDLAALLDDAPVLATGAGHDAGILAQPVSARPCCSSATPPGSRTHQPSTPSPRTAGRGLTRSPPPWSIWPVRDVLAWLEETARRRATSVGAVPGGFVVRHRDYPGAHDHNRLIITSAVDPDVLASAADDALADAPHRLIHVHDPDVAEAATARLIERGYERSDELIMIAQGVEPGRGIADGASIVELDVDERIAVATEEWRDVKSADVARQLGERVRSVLPAAQSTFLAVRSADGTLAAHVDLFVRDGLAQVEELMTAPAARGRGYGSALVVEAARRAGTNRTFIVADAADWPKDLYRRLGFADLGTTATFSRT